MIARIWFRNMSATTVTSAVFVDQDDIQSAGQLGYEPRLGSHLRIEVTPVKFGLGYDTRETVQDHQAAVIRLHSRFYDLASLFTEAGGRDQHVLGHIVAERVEIQLIGRRPLRVDKHCLLDVGSVRTVAESRGFHAPEAETADRLRRKIGQGRLSALIRAIELDRRR